MKKIIASLLTLSFCCALNAQAISIDLVPNLSSLELSDSLTLDARISGLGDASADSLGNYEFDLSYDANLFNFNSIQWGDSVLGNQLDLMGFGSLQDSDSSVAGLLKLLEVSFELPEDLDQLQAGSFTLFSLLFDTKAIGVGDFTISNLVLGDAYGANLVADSMGARVTVANATTVPEPASWLLLLGMLAIVFLRQLTTQRAK
jgi:hypothetical protein